MTLDKIIVEYEGYFILECKKCKFHYYSIDKDDTHARCKPKESKSKLQIMLSGAKD